MFDVKEKVKTIKNSFKPIIFFGICYIFGFALGLFFKNDCYNPGIYNSVTNYYIIIFDICTSVFSILFKRILTCLGVFIIVFLLGLNNISVYLASVIFFYKGLILGSVATVFFCKFGVLGLIVYIFMVAIQNVIVTAGIILIAVFNSYISDLPFKCKTKLLIENFIMCFIVCIAGALYELLFLTFILRPLTLWF